MQKKIQIMHKTIKKKHFLIIYRVFYVSWQISNCDDEDYFTSKNRYSYPLSAQRMGGNSRNMQVRTYEKFIYG